MTIERAAKNIGVIIMFIPLFIIIILAPKNKSNNNIVQYDTTYNHVVLDSIKYNIIEKEEIIINQKQQMQYEIQQNLTSSDSDAVALFYSLLSE